MPDLDSSRSFMPEGAARVKVLTINANRAQDLEVMRDMFLRASNFKALNTISLGSVYTLVFYCTLIDYIQIANVVAGVRTGMDDNVFDDIKREIDGLPFNFFCIS